MTMLEIIDVLVSILPYAMIGAAVRVGWGMYKAYTAYVGIEVAYKRIIVEFLAGMMFGIFGGVLLSTVGIFTIGMNLGTMVSSILGAHVIELIARKFGWSKKMEVIVSDQQLEFADLNPRQVNALQYVKSKGRITNKVYQKLNRTTKDVAKYELMALVRKKNLKKVGKTKDVYYVSA